MIFMEMNAGLLILWIILGIIGGGIIGFLVARWYMKKQIEKNPPINEKMIRVMFQQMGRSPSEKQVREIMRNVNNQNK